MIQDKLDHTQTMVLPSTKPSLLGVYHDPVFNTNIRRITQVTSPSVGIKPVYSTVPAWNADESLMILYRFGNNTDQHLLYDGRTYAFIKELNIQPADLEQVYWDTSDPDILYYPSGNRFIRYHVHNDQAEVLMTFNVCGNDPVSNGTDPMFTSWDPGNRRIGLMCGHWSHTNQCLSDRADELNTFINGHRFTYNISNNTVSTSQTIPDSCGTPWAPQSTPDGNLVYMEYHKGEIADPNTLAPIRNLQMVNPEEHASLGRLEDGTPTWNGAEFDANGSNHDVGNLIVWDLNNGTYRVGIGPVDVHGVETGYPYPTDGHVSAVAYKRPGWVVLSTLSGRISGPQGLLDQELIYANTNKNPIQICRLGRHWSTGKDGSVGYFAEPHAVASPSGTRIVFGSDWGNSGSVDTYVLELPGYKP